MNASNVTSITVTVDLTVDYWIQYVVFYFIVGIPGIVGNGAVFVLIIRKKKLQTFFFTLIAGHAAALILMSIECLIIGVFRICRFYIPELYNLTRIQCHFVHWLLYFSDSFSSLSMCVLAFDRTYAIVKPLLYHNYKVKHGFLVLAILAILTVFGKLLPTYFGTVSFSQKILCTSYLSPSAPFWPDYNFVTNILIIVIGIFLYVTLFAAVTFRTKTLSNLTHDSTVERMIRRQLGLLPAVKLLIVVNVCTVLSFNIFMLTSTYMGPNLSTRLFVYGTYLAAIDRFLDPIILFWKSTELRKQLKSAIGMNNQVEMTTIN